MGSSNIKSIGIDELLKYQSDPSALIVDVREKSEIDATGILPGGINIPVGDVSMALGLSNEEFHSKYGKDKPTEQTTIVFSCRSGKRSLMATEAAVKLGYLNALNFSGGWLGWEEYVKSKQ